MQRSRLILLALFFLALLLTACRAKPTTFLDEWKSAVAKKDAVFVWSLLSQASQDKMVKAIQKSQERAKTDAQHKAVLTSMGKQLTKLDGATAPPEELAVGFIKHQLTLGYGGPRISGATLIEATQTGDRVELAVDLSLTNGKVERSVANLKYEHKHWRAVVDTVAFMDVEGNVVSAWVLLPFYEGYDPQSEPPPEAGAFDVVREMRLKGGGDAARLSPAERETAKKEGRLVPVDGPPVGYDVHVKAEGKSSDDVHRSLAKVSAKITSIQYEAKDIKRGAYQDHLAALLNTFADASGGKTFPGVPWSVNEVTFAIDRGGSVVPKMHGFDAKTMKNDSKELMKLNFSALTSS